MKAKALSLLAIVACFGARPLAAQQSSATPFGFFKGQPLSVIKQLGKEVEAGSGTYHITKAPNPHPDFDGYLVMATVTHGVCKLVAMGETFDTNVYGEAVRSKFTEVQEAIERKYGTSSLTLDQLMPGSIWQEPNYWMMSLLKKERKLGSMWEGGSLPSDLSTIGVEAEALSTDRAYVSVTYEFSNFTACREELRDRKNNVF